MLPSLLPLLITILTFKVITSLRFSFYSFIIQICHWRLSYGLSHDYNIMEIIWMLVVYPYSLAFVAGEGVMEIFNHLICWKWFLLVFVFVFFLIQLLCLLLCRDLGRMKSLLSLLLPFFQTKFSFCHLYHKSFFFICSRWSVTDLAKVLPLISIKCLYTYRPGQNSTFGSIDSVICSLTMLLLYICFRVCLVSGPFYTFLFQNIYLNAHGFFFFHRNFRIYVELL